MFRAVGDDTLAQIQDNINKEQMRIEKIKVREVMSSQQNLEQPPKAETEWELQAEPMEVGKSDTVQHSSDDLRSNGYGKSVKFCSLINYYIFGITWRDSRLLCVTDLVMFNLLHSVL